VQRGTHGVSVLTGYSRGTHEAERRAQLRPVELAQRVSTRARHAPVALGVDRAFSNIPKSTQSHRAFAAPSLQALANNRREADVDCARHLPPVPSIRKRCLCLSSARFVLRCSSSRVVCGGLFLHTDWPCTLAVAVGRMSPFGIHSDNAAANQLCATRYSLAVRRAIGCAYRSTCVTCVVRRVSCGTLPATSC
jgi:hypothetical protein